MDIVEIKRRVELLQAATLQNTVLVCDVAKEIRERVTDLMMFINDNPKLFQTDSVWTYKSRTVTDWVRGVKSTHKEVVRDKCRGLGITAVFLSPEQNFLTDEWVALQQRVHDKTVWLSHWDNYGYIEGAYVQEDKPLDSDRRRMHLWRNTREKISELKRLGILTDKVFYIGGAFDCSEHPVSTAVTDSNIEKAERLGWKFMQK